MFPILFKIGSFEVRSYGVMLVLGFFVALLMARRRAGRFGLEPDHFSDAALMTLLFGILGARITFILLELPYYIEHPNEVLSWQFQGLTSFGGLAGGLLYLLWFCKKRGISARDYFDVISGPVFIAHAIGRVGCFLNGCCYGAICVAGSPFCAAFGDRLYQPAQLIDSSLNIVGYGMLVLLEKRGLFKGQSLSMFLMLHGASRFIYEFFRAGTEAQVRAGQASSTYWASLPITQAQAMAGALIATGAILFVWYGRRSTRQGAEQGKPALEEQPA